MIQRGGKELRGASKCLVHNGLYGRWRDPMIAEVAVGSWVAGKKASNGDGKATLLEADRMGGDKEGVESRESGKVRAAKAPAKGVINEGKVGGLLGHATVIRMWT